MKLIFKLIMLKNIIKKIENTVPIVVLTIIVTCAFYFRFKNLGIHGLSCDEYITGAVPNFVNRRCFIFSWIMNGYANIVVWLSGCNFVPESILRLPSAVTSIITIPVLWVLGKKLKNKYVSLLLISLYSFSFYLISYARDARFYPLYFFGSSLVCLCIIIILSNNFNNKKQEYLTYFLYAFSIVFTMGNHQGAYLLFATTNIYLFIYLLVIACKNISKEGKKSVLRELFFKLFIIAIPLFAISWHLYKISRGEMGTINDVISANQLDSVGKILPKFAWSELNLIQKSFWQGTFFSKYYFFVTVIASL